MKDVYKRQQLLRRAFGLYLLWAGVSVLLPHKKKKAPSGQQNR